MIAAHDIGAFVALAFENPQQWFGKTVELAADEPTMLQVVDVMSRMLGRPVYYNEMSIKQARCCYPNLAILRLRLDKKAITPKSLHCALCPPPMTLETWLRQASWEQAVV